ncbi:MAG: hypothetical protein IH988_03600 [Planctomycetes bacterium]|nr:hypothetical protein [Planctomycetota bacterium]
MEDNEARDRIIQKFYEAYREHGLHVIVNFGEVSASLELDAPQARRCFDYLRAKGLIRVVTLGGGYGPTVDLVDRAEAAAEAAVNG